MAEDRHFMVLVKGLERYIFVYSDSQRREISALLARYASDPALNFTWFDAATLRKKMRSLNDEEGNGIPFQR